MRAHETLSRRANSKPLIFFFSLGRRNLLGVGLKYRRYKKKVMVNISRNSSNFHFNPLKKFTQRKKKGNIVLTSSSCWFSYQKKNEYYVQDESKKKFIGEHLKCNQCAIDFFFSLYF